jgi:hypothetical protein
MSGAAVTAFQMRKETPMANKGSWLAAGAYLSEGDSLVSDNSLYQATLRGGNFMLNQGPDLGGYTYWSTGTVLPYWATTGFATLQSDGNFVLCSGSDPTHNDGAYWATNSGAGPVSYFAILHNDGNFVLYEGSDPTHQGALRWSTGLSNGQVTINNQGGYVASCQVNWIFNGQTQSQSNGNLLLGQTYSVEIPLGAYNIEVSCSAETGLVWNPWNQIFRWFESPGGTAPSRITFTLRGTTLNPSYDLEQ